MSINKIQSDIKAVRTNSTKLKKNVVKGKSDGRKTDPVEKSLARSSESAKTLSDVQSSKSEKNLSSSMVRGISVKNIKEKFKTGTISGSGEIKMQKEKEVEKAERNLELLVKEGTFEELKEVVDEGDLSVEEFAMCYDAMYNTSHIMEKLPEESVEVYLDRRREGAMEALIGLLVYSEGQKADSTYRQLLEFCSSPKEQIEALKKVIEGKKSDSRLFEEGMGIQCSQQIVKMAESNSDRVYGLKKLANLGRYEPRYMDISVKSCNEIFEIADSVKDKADALVILMEDTNDPNALDKFMNLKMNGKDKLKILNTLIKAHVPGYLQINNEKMQPRNRGIQLNFYINHVIPARDKLAELE